MGRTQQWNCIIRQHRSCHAHCFSGKLYFYNVSSGSSGNSVGDHGDLEEDQILFFRELGVQLYFHNVSSGSSGNNVGDLIGEDQILFFRKLRVNMSRGMWCLGSLGNP